MKNMKQQINEKVKAQVKKVALNAADQTIDGRWCRLGLYEAKISEKLLILIKNDC